MDEPSRSFFSQAQPSAPASWLSPSVPFNLWHPIWAEAGGAKQAGRVSDHPGEEKTRGQRQPVASLEEPRCAWPGTGMEAGLALGL